MIDNYSSYNRQFLGCRYGTKKAGNLFECLFSILLSLLHPSPQHPLRSTSTTTSIWILYIRVILINIPVGCTILASFLDLRGRFYKILKLAINVSQYITWIISYIYHFIAYWTKIGMCVCDLWSEAEPSQNRGKWARSLISKEINNTIEGSIDG